MKESVATGIGSTIAICMILAINLATVPYWKDPNIAKDMDELDIEMARLAKTRPDPDYGMCIPRMGPSNATLGGCEWLRRKT